MAQFPTAVKLVEVGARDGLQNEPVLVPTEVKIDFINRLSATGLPVIEVTSFVSPKWIPQLADSQAVFTGIKKMPGVRYPVLIPNVRGLEKALAAGVTDIAVFTTASEQFSQKNTHCTVAESLQRIGEVMHLAKQHDVPVRAYISCVLGCPYAGEMAVQKVVDLALILQRLGCIEISLGDTIGVGTPFKTKELIEALAAQLPLTMIAVHFHDTYGQALANIYAALSCGVAIVDSAVAGLGGCPYAPGASGNVATEDVVYMLQGMGITTGVDLEKLIAVGNDISTQLNRQTQSNVARTRSLCTGTTEYPKNHS